MKNLILQHWTNKTEAELQLLPERAEQQYNEHCELARKSSSNISKYSKQIGCDYKLIKGDQFQSGLKIKHPPIQKLVMLDERFDDYDIVVMLDSDMFTRKGMDQNIFTDVSGAGWHGSIQDRLAKDMERLANTNPEYSYWGGSIRRFDRELRKRLREHLPNIDIDQFCNKKWHGDEGVMHTLASHAKIRGNYITTPNWNYPSFETNVDKACIIHIRTKIAAQGPKRTKMKNYNDLVQRGIIEE